MDPEDERPFSGGAGRIVPILFAAAALFLVVSFFVGWFSVDTKLEMWFYDPAEDDGKGQKIPVIPKVDTELRPLSLGSGIEPPDVEEDIRDDPSLGLPTYSDDAPRSGSHMLGILLFSIVSFLCLAATIGVWWLNRTSKRDYGRAVWRLGALFLAVALTSLIYLGFAVPGAAEDDTHEFLRKYYVGMQDYAAFELPDADGPIMAFMLRPNVSFWKVWVCCPADTPHFTLRSTDGDETEILLQISTASRPSGGFFLTGLAIVLTGTGLGLAQRSGQIRRKMGPPRPGPTPPLPPPPLPPPAWRRAG